MEDDDQGKAQIATVPKDRFDKVYQQRKDALGRVAELEAALSDLQEKADGWSAIASQLDTVKAEYDRARGEWDSERAIMRAGLTDPEAVGIARFLHSQMPEQGRPSLAEWIDGLRQDPAQAPRALSAYLTPGQEQQAAAEQAPPPDPYAGSRTAVVGGARAAHGQPITPQRIREAVAEAQRTGDWSHYEELRKMM